MLTLAAINTRQKGRTGHSKDISILNPDHPKDWLMAIIALASTLHRTITYTALPGTDIFHVQQRQTFLPSPQAEY